ncbi:hypothetical protein [Holospora curviuscula]|uniref:hypothetical protein n=1 Tax=Holospora curviuscula TaxID=1082868 RepID=UPI0013FD8B0D|nr:hypothetical protein [Holospora curviuscula]
MKKKLKILSVVVLALACNAKAADLVPCFTPGFYFGVGLGVSSSYNRLRGSQGFDLQGRGNLPVSVYEENVGNAIGAQTAFYYGTNNISPSGWGGPGLTILPELGYSYQVPKSRFVITFYVNGGVAKSNQNVAVPTIVTDTAATPVGGDIPVEVMNSYMRVSTKGTVGLGLSFGFSSGANHYYVKTGWNNMSVAIGPRYNTMPVNEVNLGATGLPADPTAMVTVKNVTKNVSGVTFGVGFDRQITQSMSLGFCVTALNTGGSKAIRLRPANYIPNGAAYDTPVITVRPFVMAATVVMKYVFMPKKK